MDRDSPSARRWTWPLVAVSWLLASATACSQAPGDGDGRLPAPASVAAPDPDPQPATALRIPERFQGEWQRTAATCGSADEGRLLVEPASVRFHESIGDLQALHADGQRLDLALLLRGEGQSREATYRFELSQDGRRLTDLSSGNGMVRLRCP